MSEYSEVPTKETKLHQRPQDSRLSPLRPQVPLPPLFDHKFMRQRRLALLPTDGEHQAHRYDDQEDYDSYLRRSKRLGTISVAKMPEYLNDQYASLSESESLVHVLNATFSNQRAPPEVFLQNSLNLFLHEKDRAALLGC
jgi:hypothetical protein